MKFKDLFIQQVRTVIEWTEQDPSVLFFRIETPSNEIKTASKLIVSPGQGCIIVYQGRVLNTIEESGIYELKTSNHPFITTLTKVLQNFDSEHIMHIYYYRKAEITNQKWGTINPIKYLDSVYRLPVELGAFGNFSVFIEDAESMFNNLIGSRQLYTTKDLRTLISSRISSELASLLARLKYSYIDIDANLSEMSNSLLIMLNSIFSTLGFKLTDFRIESTSFDDDTRRRIDKIADMTTESLSAKEVQSNYIELEKLKAMRDMARNEGGGIMSNAMQLSAGIRLGTSAANDLSSSMRSNLDKKDTDDYIEQLKKLKELVNQEIITQEEFEAKKKEILSRI